MTKGVLKRFLKVSFFLLLPILVFAAAAGTCLHYPVQPKEETVVVEKGMPFREITGRLSEKGIIRYRWLFFFYGYLRGAAREIRTGEYLFDRPISPANVLEKLIRGRVNAFRVAIIEGWTLRQIADTLGTLSFIKNPDFTKEFLKLTEERDFILSLELDVPTLEGYLFPETYFFYADTPPAEYLQNFTAEFHKNYQIAMRDLRTLPALSRHQIVTMASIIEKETGVNEEKPLIASVFYNRLKRGMPLQSDPTVIYGLKNFDGDIRKADLSNPHLYNTYVHKDLPPGPICNPGLASIRAALDPAQTDYFYFVSKGDGTHQFSETAAEHEEGVKRLLLRELMAPVEAPAEGPDQGK